jgi:hypothetical protein
MRKSNALLSTMLFVIAMVCCPSKVVSQVSPNLASQAVEVTDPEAGPCARLAALESQ